MPRGGTESEVEYTYDANGNVLTMEDGTGTTTRTYDSLDRMLTKSVPNVGTLGYTYDQTDGLTTGYSAVTSTDPKGNITKKVYDNAGRLKEVVANLQATVYTYNDNGSVAEVEYGSGVKEQYTYYTDGLLNTLTNRRADNSVISAYSYTYDYAHNMASKTDSRGTTEYTYDGLNRIDTIEEPDGTVTAYTYDNNNIVEKTETSGTVTKLTEYVYDVNNRLTATESSRRDTSESQDFVTQEEVAFEYDFCGNQTEATLTPYVDGVAGTAYVSGEYAYDMWNQMTEATVTDALQTSTTVKSAYNGEGLRTVKTVGTDTTYYLLENQNVVLELDGNGDQTGRNVYGLNAISRTADSSTLYYLYNGHGDVTAMADDTGTVQATYYYDAFGVITARTGNFDNSISFSGYLFDAETGLYYLNARMYDPYTARFMQEDTYNGDAASILSLNIYVYCANNPVKYVDPSGHMPEIVSDLCSTFDYILDMMKAMMLDIMAEIGKLSGLVNQYFGSMYSAFMLKMLQEASARDVLIISGLIVGIGFIISPVRPIVGAGLVSSDKAPGMTSKSLFNPNTESQTSGNAHKTGLSNFVKGMFGKEMQQDSDHINVLYAVKGGHQKKGTTNPSNKSKHQKGDSRRNKDQNRGEKGDDRRTSHSNKRIKKISTETVVAGAVMIASAVAIVYLVANDFTGVGVADDAAIIPLIKVFWESATKVFA